MHTKHASRFAALLVLALALTLLANSAHAVIWNCTREEAAKAFKQKKLLYPTPAYENDPYLNQTEESYAEIYRTLNDTELVCAIRYEDAQKKFYTIKQFPSAARAQYEGYIVTHQGHCGSCSTLQDLSVYLEKNLTAPVRLCGIEGTLLGADAGIQCLMNLGFSDNCAIIYYFNAVNTRKYCSLPCVYMLITREPYVKPDGSLNECLQCDEDISGPVFKYYAGRSRRNSGIRSEIDRPQDQIYNMSQCYY